MFGSFGKATAKTSLTFVSQAAFDAGVHAQLGLEKQIVPIRGTRAIGKKDMIHNDATPTIDVNPETYEVSVDGERATCEPATVVPMAQRYFMF
jgi:urease subunit alpha